jgi:Protein of unknown function (DUF4031)
MASLTLAEITQQIKSQSPLGLHNDVAQDFAENLIAAQAPGVCSYCALEPTSLQLSVNAVIKALNLERSFGIKYCDDSNCTIAWEQSNIAVDTNVHVVITPSALTFNPVTTPEPSTLVFIYAALIGVALWNYCQRQRKWIQLAGTYKEHYDVCMAMRRKAVELGAIEIGWRDVADKLKERRAERAKGEQR